MSDKKGTIIDALMTLADRGFITISAEQYGFGYQKIASAISGFLNQMLVMHQYRFEKIDFDRKNSFEFLAKLFHFEIPAIKDEGLRALPLDTIKEITQKGKLSITPAWGADYHWMATALENLFIYFDIAHEVKREQIIMNEEICATYGIPPLFQTFYHFTVLTDNQTQKEAA